jgi:hypothetical protein
MRRPLLVLLVLAALAGTAICAGAAPRALRYADILRAANGGIVIPPEWDGVWASEDSVYDCQGNLDFVETYLDTLCSGQVYGFDGDDPTGGLFPIDCSGTATATTAQLTCTASGEVVEDCTISFTSTLDAVRTASTFVAVSVTDISYSGTGFGCDFIPAECTRVVTHATRLGPAPTAYCATPSRSSSWGEVRIRYR